MKIFLILSFGLATVRALNPLAYKKTFTLGAFFVALDMVVCFIYLLNLLLK